MEIKIQYNDAPSHRIQVSCGDAIAETIIPENIYIRMYTEQWLHGKHYRLELLVGYMVNVLYPAKVPVMQYPSGPDRKFDHTCMVAYNDGKMSVNLDGEDIKVDIKHSVDSRYTDFAFSQLPADCIRVLRLLVSNMPVS